MIDARIALGSHCEVLGIAGVVALAVIDAKFVLHSLRVVVVVARLQKLPPI